VESTIRPTVVEHRLSRRQALGTGLMGAGVLAALMSSSTRPRRSRLAARPLFRRAAVPVRSCVGIDRWSWQRCGTHSTGDRRQSERSGRSGCFFGAIVTVNVNAQKRTEIEKAPAEVYRFIANEHGRNQPRWDGRAVEFTLLDPGSVAVGTRFAYKLKALG
jgi:hypothetical protein